DGVPGVLEVLRLAKARATFYVTFGPSRPAPRRRALPHSRCPPPHVATALRKLLNPTFALKMCRTKAASTYGWATAFYGTLLKSPLVGAGLPDTLQRIRDEGHEPSVPRLGH